MTPAEKLFACANSLNMLANRFGRRWPELERIEGEVRDVAETLKRATADSVRKHAGGRK